MTENLRTFELTIATRRRYMQLYGAVARERSRWRVKNVRRKVIARERTRETEEALERIGVMRSGSAPLHVNRPPEELIAAANLARQMPQRHVCTHETAEQARARPFRNSLPNLSPIRPRMLPGKPSSAHQPSVGAANGMRSDLSADAMERALLEKAHDAHWQYVDMRATGGNLPLDVMDELRVPQPFTSPERMRSIKAAEALQSRRQKALLRARLYDAQYSDVMHKLAGAGEQHKADVTPVFDRAIARTRGAINQWSYHTVRPNN